VDGQVQVNMICGIHIMTTGSPLMIFNHLVDGVIPKSNSISIVMKFVEQQLIVISIEILEKLTKNNLKYR
jgi:hypothetical protein